MTSDWLGGGLIVGLAAVLWLIYLVPTWFRRNEFIATERNVVRLQQTLRILAETSEVPNEVRVETTARSVAEQQRLLKKATAKSVVEQQRVLKATSAASTPPRSASKLRQARAVTTGILALALLVVVLGSVQLVLNGAWVVLAVGAVSATFCLTRLRGLAKHGRALRALAASSSPRGDVLHAPHTSGHRRRSIDGAGFEFTPAALDDDTFASDELVVLEQPHDDSDPVFDDRGDDAGWMPVPIPRPLYAARRRYLTTAADESFSAAYAQQTAAQAEEALLAAARSAESALRESHARDDDRAAARTTQSAGEKASAPVSQAPAAQTPPSRFSSMGILDGLDDTAHLDVDGVLARRRAG